MSPSISHCPLLILSSCPSSSTLISSSMYLSISSCPLPRLYLLFPSSLLFTLPKRDWTERDMFQLPGICFNIPPFPWSPSSTNLFPFPLFLFTFSCHWKKREISVHRKSHVYKTITFFISLPIYFSRCKSPSPDPLLCPVPSPVRASVSRCYMSLGRCCSVEYSLYGRLINSDSQLGGVERLTIYNAMWMLF